jgi:hypothetical protein
LAMIFLILLFGLFFVSVKAFSSEVTVVNLKDIKNLKKDTDYTYYITINAGKIKNNHVSGNVFFTENSENFVIEAKYTTEPRKLSQKNKDFLREWLLAKYENRNNTDKSLMLSMQGYQFDLFYREIYLIYNGGGQRFIIQKTLADKLIKEPKNSTFQFNVALLGFLNNTDDYFLITGYTKNTTRLNVSKNDYIIAKNAIIEERYDYAYSKLQNYLKVYPNNLEARKDLCVVEFAKYQKFLDKNSINTATACFENLMLMYKKPEMHYMLALLYYQNPTMDEKVKLTKTLSNLNEAVGGLGGKNNLTLDESIVYYNSLYLRGVIKLKYGDKRGLDDLSIVERERPDMVNLNVFEETK